MNTITPTISLSFDDGRKDNIKIAIPILNKYNLKATFNITTGYIDNSASNKPTNLPAMSVEDVKMLHYKGHEIAGHGDEHRNDKADIVKGLEKLKKWLCVKYLGFASPGTGFVDDSKTATELLDCGLLYIRVSVRYNSYNCLKILCRKFSRVIKFPLLYRLAYQDTCFEYIDDKYIYSVPILKDATFQQIRTLLQYSFKQKKHIVLMLHSVMKRGEYGYEDNWTMDEKVFDKICRFLSDSQNNGICKVVTTLEQFKNYKKSNV